MLKGATGMGTPVIAVPVMASFFDVRLAVALMVLPNPRNSWLWKYRAHFPKDGLAYRFALAGLGPLSGTILLAKVSPDILINPSRRQLCISGHDQAGFQAGPEIALKTSFQISTISGVLPGLGYRRRFGQLSERLPP